MTSIVARAAREFLNDEAKRKSRPRFTPAERGELDFHVKVLENVESDTVTAHAGRGFVAISLVGYNDDVAEDPAVNVIADILQHVKLMGMDPMTVLAHARAEFFRDEKLGPIGVPSEVSDAS
ncbi:hypothetical protein SEA_RASPUTIA_122 [Microbacterium phage Rasputia]|nr:hypothetical protein SEA_RASPUTIA_122 [Microbacterium phage Rasputia]